jgi:predicted nucleic acid-binding protein
MTRILLDTNVVLDVLLARAPWVTDAQVIWQACVDTRVDGVIVATSLTNIFYIVRRAADRAAALDAIDACLDAMRILPIDARVFDVARTLGGTDFEDDVQIAAALRWGAQMIVTRDPSGFAKAACPVVDAAAARVRLGL